MPTNAQNTSLNEALGADLRKLGTFATSSRMRLVPYSDEHFEDHLRLRLALYPALTNAFLQMDNGLQNYRKMQVEDLRGIKLMIHGVKTDEFVGEVAISDFDEAPWEIGWDILPAHQRKGYATSAARLLIDRLASLPECPGIIARMDADNPASIKVARKLGGAPSGTSMTFIARALGEEGRARFVREHRDLLADEIGDLAQEFDVEPEELLTHVLVFRIV
jgi:RimJ/RimL family protein N-acetyltransferase